MDAHKQHNQNAISSDFFLCIMISPSHTWTPEKMQASNTKISPAALDLENNGRKVMISRAQE